MLNGEYRTIPMNIRLFETLKMVDKRSDFVFHREDGMCACSSVWIEHGISNAVGYHFTADREQSKPEKRY